MRYASTRVRPLYRQRARIPCLRHFHTSQSCGKESDPRLGNLGTIIEEEYAALRDHYRTPKHPVVLAHGLMGFDELSLTGSFFQGLLPRVHYWRGIREAMILNGIEVITASVPPTASLEERAERLNDFLAVKAKGKDVNMIAHSMGGLDSRYMISQLRPKEFRVRSLTTIASPHRGSAFADYVFAQIGVDRLPRVYKALGYLHIDSGAFNQLTRKYMRETFNPKTPDVEDVRYFSYGATFEPSLFSVFRHSHRIVEQEEGPNDGLVSVASSKWGGESGYKGTLKGVSHLDLINWTNRLKWVVGDLTGHKRKFNAIAFYLDIADMLAKEGL